MSRPQGIPLTFWSAKGFCASLPSGVKGAIMSCHILKVVLLKEEVKLSVECLGLPGSDCRTGCVMGCDDACTDPDNHVKSADFCFAADWLNSFDIAACYAGDDEILLVSGMSIDVEWNGDDYEWTVPRQ